MRILDRQTRASDLPADMRGTERHGLSMELRFSCRSGGVTCIGTGRTRNLGRETLCFETDQELRGSGELELRIPWPVPLQSICPLELVVRGSLIRKDAAVAVIRMESYEFQTLGNRSFSPVASRGVTCDVAA